jgi:Holliday junction DNA helicase RuvB
VFIKAAQTRNTALDHTLFYGPPGLGKTTLAQIIAKEMGANLKYMSGPSISKGADLAAILTNLQEKDVLFIDEVHRLNINVEEMLYSAMEDFALDIVIGEGSSARNLRINLPPFTLIGATTRLGLLSGPLRDRFGIPLRLNFYNTKELYHILVRGSKVIGIDSTEDGYNGNSQTSKRNAKNRFKAIAQDLGFRRSIRRLTWWIEKLRTSL